MRTRSTDDRQEAASKQRREVLFRPKLHSPFSALLSCISYCSDWDPADSNGEKPKIERHRETEAGFLSLLPCGLLFDARALHDLRNSRT